jgi:hypothetical protein
VVSGPLSSPEPRRAALIVDTRLDYPGYFECRSSCRLRIYRHGGQNIAVATELHDNPGTSVTNAVETICHLAVREYELDPDRTIFIEHYPGRLQRSLLVRGETFDLVTFGERLWDHYEDPSWRRLHADQVSELIGQPWVPEAYPVPDPNR